MKGRSGKENPSYKHGFSKTRFYKVYDSMRDRCNRRKCSSYDGYGGRGIKCLWHDFASFKDDMYQGYLEHAEKHGELNTFIERIDNDGNYEKVNCRWASKREQANNRRSSRFLSKDGRTQTLAQWSRELGLNTSTIKSRLRDGWTDEEALSSKLLKPHGRRAA